MTSINSNSVGHPNRGIEIRPITRDEAVLCLPQARAFFSEGAIPGTLNEDHFVSQIQQFLDMDIGLFIAAIEDGQVRGAIGGVAYPDFATGDVTAVELFWFVGPEYRMVGVKLLVAFEDMAKAKGCKRIHMVHLVNYAGAKLDRFFERRGYKLTEMAFTKDI